MKELMQHNNNVKQFIWILGAALMFVLTCVLSVGCSANETIAPTDSPIPTKRITPAPTPSPTPKVEQTEPERAELARSINVPDFYTNLTSEEETFPLYAFLNENGVVEYRTVGVICTLSDGVIVQEDYSFFPAEETGELAATTPILPENERPGVCIALDISTFRLKRDYRAMEAIGGITAEESGDHYVYGTVGNTDPAFYPADETGEMIPGALPIETERFVVSPYAPSVNPTKEGQRHIVVFIGSQSVVVFRAENGDWEVEKVFICSTGDGGRYTPRGDFSITAQYEYKAMSRLNGVMVYAQYASRFRGHYLFHTVPSAGQYKNYLPNGKQQILIAEYEKLGTDVSHGCVRMLVGDCYWIYRNCRIGTRVTVTDAAGPDHPEKPKLIYEEPYMDVNHQYGWDPTDPDPHNPYLSIPSYAAGLIVPTIAPKHSATARPTHAPVPKYTPVPTPEPTARPIGINYRTK